MNAQERMERQMEQTAKELVRLAGRLKRPADVSTEMEPAWGPPAKGTHESDLGLMHGWYKPVCVNSGRCINEFDIARQWSRS